MGKIDDKKSLKNEQLLNTAFHLFTTQGIYKTSVSDIAKMAGVAKGTFYLYYRDKYDIANRLIEWKASQLYTKAIKKLQSSQLTVAEQRVIFVIDCILDDLQHEHLLLRFINKNLSWGIFRNVMTNSEHVHKDLNCVLTEIFQNDISKWDNLETLFYIILELVGSSCYSVILEKDPMTIDEFKPHLYKSIKAILQAYKKS